MSEPTVAPAAPAAAVSDAAPAAGAELSIDALSALIPDSALRAEPAPVAIENTADAADAAKLGDQPAEEPKQAETPEQAPAPEPVDTEALERAEAAAKRAREGSRRYREALEAQRQQQMEVQRAAREAERLRQENEEARRLRDELKKDPYAALKQLGMTDRDLAERALREGTPEAAIHSLNERLERAEQARAALENRLAEERAAVARQQVEENFARVADNESSFPRLAQLTNQAQLVIARAALKQIADNGYDVSGFSDTDVAEACERYLAPKKGKATTAPKQAPVAAPTPAAPKPSGKTLTNAVATERAVAPKPWHELSEDEQIAQIAAALPDP